MKNFKTVLMTIVALAVVFATFAFVSNPGSNSVETEKFMIVTTIESIIPGGFGRSRMFVTDENGKLESEVKMKNMYSLVGIKMKNVNLNDAMITTKINEVLSKGWKLEHVSTGVQSPSIGSNGGKGEGIYLTRYYFKK